MAIVSTSRSIKNQPERALTEVLLRGDPAGWLGWNPQPWQVSEVLEAWASALGEREKPGSPKTLQVYTHFAFCRMSCRFCQYWHVLTRDDAELEAYTDHLIALLALYRNALGRVRVSNAYFGGGTPTALTASMLRRFLTAFRDTFEVAHELTTEAHPSTLDAEKILLLADAGVSRISMGLQSFDEGVLHHVGRTNGSSEALRNIVETARKNGILINVDLIVGLPTQTPSAFRDDLDATLELLPDTVTVYRYQPVHRLPQPPTSDMHYSLVLRPLLMRCATRRYFPIGPIDDSRYSVLLVRASGKTARYLGANVRSVLESTRGKAELRRYTDVDRDDVHLMGIGPGAISHICGSGWFRDVTAVRSGAGQASPRYWGTRLTSADELRSHVVIGLGSGDWMDDTLVRQDPGDTDVARLIAVGVAGGLLRRAFRWVRFRSGVGPDERAAFLRAILPTRPLDGAHAARAFAFKLRKDVEPDLVDIDRAYRELLP